jgi:hypothetical protein
MPLRAFFSYVRNATASLALHPRQEVSLHISRLACGGDFGPTILRGGAGRPILTQLAGLGLGH